MIGLIGGSGLYDMAGFVLEREETVKTPFGDPSDAYMVGHLGGVRLVFLSRHGRRHLLLPSEINHRANIYGLKRLGVTRVLAVTAVGSLKEEYRPRDLLLPDQYFDRTKRGEEHSFFGQGVVAHVAFGEPVCARLRRALHQAAVAAAGAQPDFQHVRIHDGGVYVNMEGPAFSTRAESEFYRQCGFDVIGMTSLAEAKLCREAELCYAPLAMITDYDCWHQSEEIVSADMVVENVKANARLALDVLRQAAAALPSDEDCPCRHALEGALMTRPDAIPEATRRDLEPILGRFL